MKRLSLVLLSCLLLLAACSSQKVLSGAEADAVLAFSEPATDALLAGYNAADYAAFSAGFDDAMRAAISETAFPDFYASIHGKLGNYVSREVKGVIQSGSYYSVIYTAVFENDSPVTMRVVFTLAEPHRISGLWFDSARLREK